MGRLAFAAPLRRLAFAAPALAVALAVCAACAADLEPGADAMEGTAPDHAAHLQGLPAGDGPGFVVADVRFMQGMIVHHAQAIVMAEMAATHGAGPRLLQLARKIDISQRDEIEMMERWLAERGQVVPDSAYIVAARMPGMASPEQMAELDAARGTEFDRTFLTLMILHHEGALDMVDTLFADPRAAQDSDIFRFVTDVQADQSAEIDAMTAMLDALSGSQVP